MNILLVTGFTTADWHRAEALFDWHRKLHDQMPSGHVLLVAAKDAHDELRTKLRIAAELAFETVREFQVSATPQGKLPKEHIFREAALHIGQSLRWPWLWLEPDCVPLKRNWITRLEDAYEDQPARYMGTYFKVGQQIILPRVSVYPAVAINDFLAQRELLPMSTKTRLIQYGLFSDSDDLSKVREDAVLFHSCKTNALIEKLDALPRDAGSKLIGSSGDFKAARKIVGGVPFKKKASVQHA